MNFDVKFDSEKIAIEIISGTVEQACEDYVNILGNYNFHTSSPVEKSFLSSLGMHLAKHVRKRPDNFLLFCKKIWYDSISDNKIPLGLILASLETINPAKIIPEIIAMCRDASRIEEVDIMVTGFEPVVIRNPQEYFHILESYIKDESIWIKRMIIVAVGHIMYRHKNPDITHRCLELMRPEMSNECEHIRKATSWIIASYGVRVDQRAIASFVLSFAGSENPVIVLNITDAFRRSKIAFQKEVCDALIPMFEAWSHSPNSDISKSAHNTLRLLKST